MENGTPLKTSMVQLVDATLGLHKPFTHNSENSNACRVNMLNFEENGDGTER